MAIEKPQYLLIAISFVAASVLFSFSESLPFVVLHGVGDQCKNRGITWFTESLSNHSGQEGFCIEIGDGALDSWFMSMTKQVESACDTIKSLPQLQSGYNLVGLSQGNVIGRGLVEWCDGGPPVKNMISIGGPHAGTASVPMCGNGLVCEFADAVIQLGVYSSYVQEHLGPAGYVKIPMDLKGYSKGCKFLPKLNNEFEDNRNATYKERFTSLNQLVLIMFENDKVLIPPETAWFSYYSEENFRVVLPVNETDLYVDDWIGLRSLDEAGKVTWISLPGGHLQINEAEMLTYVVPHLADASFAVM